MKADELKNKIAEQFIKSLESEKLNWCKEWKNGLNPCNGVSNRTYSGTNKFLLLMMSHANKFEGNRFYTFNQIEKAKLSLKDAKGKGLPVSYWLFLYKKNPDDKGKWISIEEKGRLIREGKAVEQDFPEMRERVTYVFNEDLIPELEKEDIHIYSNDEKFEVLNRYMKEAGIELYQSKMNSSAYYSPSQNKIVLPPDSHFFDRESYLATLAHEIAHSTAKSLERDLSGKFGSEQYAKEELVAEISSAFICAELQIDPTANINNNIAYVQSWASKIKDDKTYLLDAIKQANKVCNHVRTLSEQNLNKEKEKALSIPSKSKEAGIER